MLFTLYSYLLASCSFFESLSVRLYPHHWPSTALALVSRDLHVVSGQFSVPLLLDPPVVSSILPETLLSPRLPAASLLSEPYWPRCRLPSLGAPLSPFCLVSFLIPAWRSQATKDPSILTSALSPVGGIGRKGQITNLLSFLWAVYSVIQLWCGTKTALDKWVAYSVFQYRLFLDSNIFNFIRKYCFFYFCFFFFNHFINVKTTPNSQVIQNRL